MERNVIDDPALKQRFSFSRSRDEDGDEVLHVEVWVDPGGGVPPHVHPVIEERFNVLEGRGSFLAGRKWQDAGPGETVVVPPGIRHAYRNRGDEQVHFVCDVRPPSSLQGFLEDAAAMGRAGKLATRWAIPKGLGGLLQGAVLAESYRDMVVLGFPPLPPPAIQRLLFPPLARLGERRGYRAGHFSERAEA
jgi:quercetin dioxygenase-like cupin family protein